MAPQQSSEPSALASTAARPCPQCGAANRHEVPWCLQCYAPLQSTAEPAVESAVESADPAVDGPDVEHADEPAEADLTDAQREALTTRLLAELAAAERPTTGWSPSWLPATGPARVGVLTGIVLVGAAGLVALMALVGLLV